MAYLLEVNEPRNQAERQAQIRLRDILPNDWIVTTNLAEKNFPREKAEIDSILITPYGVWLLDFKHLTSASLVIPKFNSPWIGLNERKNPIDQSQKNVFVVKNDILEAYDADLKNIWIEWLIVLTANGVDWSQSDIRMDLRAHICCTNEVQQRVLEISRSRISLSAERARKVVKALKPRGAEPPVSFFSSWPEPQRRREEASRTPGSLGGDLNPSQALNGIRTPLPTISDLVEAASSQEWRERKEAIRKYGLLVILPVVVIVIAWSLRDWLDEGHSLASPSLSSVAKFANTFWIAILVVGVALFGYFATDTAIRQFGAKTADKLQAFATLAAVILLALGGLYWLSPHLFDSSEAAAGRYPSQKNCEAVVGANRACLLGEEWVRPARLGLRPGDTVTLCVWIPNRNNLLKRSSGAETEFRAERGRMVAVMRLFPGIAYCHDPRIVNILSSGV